MESLIYESEDLESVIINNINVINTNKLIDIALCSIRDKNIQAVDTQKLFFHFFIIEVCEYIKKNDSCLLYLNTKMPQICKEEGSVLVSLTSKALNALSRNYITWPHTLSYFVSQITTKSDNELILFEKSINKNKAINPYIKLSTFLKRNGLSFLQNTYFQNPTNKLLLFR